MDRRENAPEESGFVKDLKAEAEADYDDKVEYNGKVYRVPYRMVKEVVFSGIPSQELKDMEHSARLQYRLLLLDSVLKAKVEFIRGRITITYNPEGAANRKEKISLSQLKEFLEKEGVRASGHESSERDVDYFEEIYKYQFEPATIREHAPYGYTMQEWKRMKPEWEAKQKAAIEAKYTKFKAWQETYLESHEELAKQYGHTAPAPKKLSIADRLMGKGKKGAKTKEKGFWFHGV